jgi:hypothetical protein
MSIEVLREELAALPQAERSKIMAFLVALQDRDDTTYRERLARMIDDKTPGRWMRVEEADHRLGIDRGELS